jgi:hypothetical protein
VKEDEKRDVWFDCAKLEVGYRPIYTCHAVAVSLILMALRAASLACETSITPCKLATAWKRWIQCNASREQPSSHVHIALASCGQTDVCGGDACIVSVAD